MELTPQQLRCVVAVAHELNFTRAAARLTLSPSTVSEQVAAAERRVGRALFVRSSRAVTRTAAADELLPLAHRALEAMGAITEWAASPDAHSTIVVGVIATSNRFHALLADARAVSPDVDWRIRQLSFQPLYKALRRGELDVAFLAEIGPRAPADDIATHDLWAERLVVMVAEDHPLVERRVAQLADLAGERLIAGPHGRENKQQFAALLELVPGAPAVMPIANNVQETAEMCRAGIGVTVVTDSAIQMLHRPGLAFVPLRDAPRVTMRMHMRGRDPSRVLSILVDIARAHASRAPTWIDTRE